MSRKIHIQFLETAPRVQPPATLPSPRLLMPIVQKVVGKVSDQALVPVAGFSSSPAFQPRSLLALLTYCYAMGTYAPQAVEVELRNSPFHCGGIEVPDWYSLHRFRRCNRQVLVECLKQTLYLAWVAQEQMFGRYEQHFEASSGLLNDCCLRNLATQEAIARIEQVAFLDEWALT